MDLHYNAIVAMNSLASGGGLNNTSSFSSARSPTGRVSDFDLAAAQSLEKIGQE
jgi:hypothetical protein